MTQSNKSGSPKFGSEEFSQDAANAASLHPDKDIAGVTAANASNDIAADLKALRSDLNSLTETVTNFIARTGNEAAKSAREITTNLAEQVGNIAEKGANVASIASDQGKNLANELESMARRNPFGVIAGAVLVGVVIGMMGRRN
jgi:ElaB/YqjD/DUF883 family membrane-anchored ribosome-binding protein